MHHLIGRSSCLCLSLHHSISSVITHMPQRGGRPDNGRLKGPRAQQRGAAVCRYGNRTSTPTIPEPRRGKTQWQTKFGNFSSPNIGVWRVCFLHGRISLRSLVCVWCVVCVCGVCVYGGSLLYLFLVLFSSLSMDFLLDRKSVV